VVVLFCAPPVVTTVVVLLTGLADDVGVGDG